MIVSSIELDLSDWFTDSQRLASIGFLSILLAQIFVAQSLCASTSSSDAHSKRLSQKRSKKLVVMMMCIKPLLLGANPGCSIWLRVMVFFPIGAPAYIILRRPSFHFHLHAYALLAPIPPSPRQGNRATEVYPLSSSLFFIMVPGLEHSYPPKPITYIIPQRDDRLQSRHPTPRAVAPTLGTPNNRSHRPHMEALIREAINTTHTDSASPLLREETVSNRFGYLTVYETNYYVHRSLSKPSS